MGKSVVVLSSGRFKAFGIEDGEWVHCLRPVPGRLSPVGGDALQGWPYQLGGCVSAREVPLGLETKAQLGMDVLDGVSGVDHLAVRRGKH